MATTNEILATIETNRAVREAALLSDLTLDTNLPAATDIQPDGMYFITPGDNDIINKLNQNIKILHTAVDVETARVDDILFNAGADLATFADLVTLVNSIDTVNDVNFVNYVTANDARSLTIETNATNEINRAVAAELILTNDLATESSRAVAAEDILTTDLATTNSKINSMFVRNIITGDITFTGNLLPLLTSTLSLGNTDKRIVDIYSSGTIHLGLGTTISETGMVIAGPITATNLDDTTTVDTKIAAETARATNAEGVIAGNLTAETSRATLAESGLSTDISNEAARATAAELVLTTNVDAEIARATAAEAAITTAHTTAEATLTANIGSLITLTTFDKANLVGAINEVQGETNTVTADLATEVARATAAEVANTTALTAETARATAVEAALQLELDTYQAADASALNNVITGVTPVAEATHAIDATTLGTLPLSPGINTGINHVVRTDATGAILAGVVNTNVLASNETVTELMYTTGDGNLKKISTQDFKNQFNIEYNERIDKIISNKDVVSIIYNATGDITEIWYEQGFKQLFNYDIDLELESIDHQKNDITLGDITIGTTTFGYLNNELVSSTYTAAII